MKLPLLDVKTRANKDFDNLFFPWKINLSFSLGISIATSLNSVAHDAEGSKREPMEAGAIWGQIEEVMGLRWQIQVKFKGIISLGGSAG